MALKYFDKAPSFCFISLGGKRICDLTDIGIDLSNDIEEISSFDDAFIKNYLSTSTDYKISATGLVTDTTNSFASYSGSTLVTNGTVTGSTNAFNLLELAKTRPTLTLCIKLDVGNVQRSQCLIADVSFKGSVGKHMTYDLKLQPINGGLVKSTL